MSFGGASSREAATPGELPDLLFSPPEYELKLEVGRFRVEALAAHLAAFCRPDPKYPSNSVVSVYFDTPDLRLLGEKIDSHYLKTKVRLRWYEDDAEVDAGSSATEAFLEVKRRIGSRRRKARFETGLSGADLRDEPLHSRAFLGLPEQLLQRGLDLPGPLRPLMTIRYHRRRFVEPFSGSRVCLDTEIRVTALDLARLPPAALPAALPGGVLEIKGQNAALPPALTHLSAAGAFKSSFSKYGRCYSLVTGVDA